MQRERTILDDVYHQIKRHSKFDFEEQYDLNTLWNVGSYLLSYEEIRAFDHFPMLAFMSPEPDSGKTNALKVTSKLAFNATPPGSFTTASILRKIDKSDKPITVCLDDLDTKFTHGKDNADLVMLFNIGYERGSMITRCSQKDDDGLIETPAYCPKAFSGLRIAKIPGPTLTRTLIINMRPKTADDNILEEMDNAALENLRKRIGEWAPSIVDTMETIELPEDDIKFLLNRKKQILKPLLTLAKAISEDWYQRALRVAWFFSEQQAEKTLTHKILFAAYRVCREGRHPNRIHSGVLVDELIQLGIPSYIDPQKLADHLSSYDIKPRQMEIQRVNRNGYQWRSFESAFTQYITKKEIEEVEMELGITNNLDSLDALDGKSPAPCEDSISPQEGRDIPSLGSSPSSRSSPERDGPYGIHATFEAMLEDMAATVSVIPTESQRYTVS